MSVDEVADAELVLEVCRRRGYGRVMQIASEGWDVVSPGCGHAVAPSLSLLEKRGVGSWVDLLDEYDRLRKALDEIADEAVLCQDCDEDEHVRRIATHETLFAVGGAAYYVCAEHAETHRESNRKAESKGCGKQPDVFQFVQEKHVAIALAALAKKGATTP